MGGLMADIYRPNKRSEIMARVRTTGTRPERIVRQVAHGLELRFRLHRKDLPGRPDLVFPRYRKVIFVHGCFWHGHKHCKKAKLPTTNRTFWESKLMRNVQRDQSNIDAFYRAGWQVLIVWECQTKDPESIAASISLFLKNNGVSKG